MFASLFRLLDRSRRSSAPWKTKHRAVPSLEALEERWVPSTAGDALTMQSLLGAGFNSLNTPPASATNTNATPTQQVTATFTPFTTGGSQTQSVAQFDPSLGTLNSVQIILNGKLTSDVKVENLDAAPSTVNAQVNGNISLQGPGGTTLLSVSPSIVDNSTSLSAYDGTLDYAGTSGHDFGDQSSTAQKSITLTNNLSAWEGKGNVALTEAAQSSSTVSGSGNEQVHICSEGSGTATVIYNYTPKPQSPPPAPPPSPPPSPPPCDNMSPPPASPPPASPPPSGPASINGFVYIAPTQSATYDPSDPVPGKATVTLTGVTLTQQQVSETATTDPKTGSYNFANLQPGVYAVTDQPIPTQFTPGAATLGNYGGVLSNGQMLLALPQGGDAVNYDFGLFLPSAPSVAPTSSPTASPSASPSASPPPSDPTPATPVTLPLVISKRSLLGDGWQSLG